MFRNENLNALVIFGILCDWFIDDDRKESKLIEYAGRRYWVDRLNQEGYSVQSADDPMRVKKCWSMAGATEAIIHWKGEKNGRIRKHV